MARIFGVYHPPESSQPITTIVADYFHIDEGMVEFVVEPNAVAAIMPYPGMLIKETTNA
jgi:hypothetical protein